MTQNLFFYSQLFGMRQIFWFCHLHFQCTFSYPRLSCFQYLSHYKSPHTPFIIVYFFRRVVSFLSWFSICFHISSTTLLSIGHLSFLPPKHSPFLHLSASTSAPAQTPPWRTKEQIVFVAYFRHHAAQNYGVSRHFPVSAWIALSEKNTRWTCALPACFVTFKRIFSGITFVLHLLTLETMNRRLN